MAGLGKPSIPISEAVFRCVEGLGANDERLPATALASAAIGQLGPELQRRILTTTTPADAMILATRGAGDDSRRLIAAAIFAPESGEE